LKLVFHDHKWLSEVLECFVFFWDSSVSLVSLNHQTSMLNGDIFFFQFQAWFKHKKLQSEGKDSSMCLFLNTELTIKQLQSQTPISIVLWAMSLYQQEATNDAGHSASLLGMIDQSSLTCPERAFVFITEL